MSLVRLPVRSNVAGEPGQFLQSVKHLAPRADQLIERRSDDGHDRPVAFHIHVDVAVKVSDVQEALDIVGRDLTL